MNPISGGPIQGVKDFIVHNARLGVQTEIAVLDDPNNSPWLKDLQVPVYPLGPARLEYAFTPHLGPWLKANASNYDAVIVNGLWQYNGYAVWKALRGTNTPY